MLETIKSLETEAKQRLAQLDADIKKTEGRLVRYSLMFYLISALFDFGFCLILNFI